MKQIKHIAEAVLISDDSYSLIHFHQLRGNASKVKQVEALKADQIWQQDHHDEITQRIDALIRSIEEEETDAEK